MTRRTMLGAMKRPQVCPGGPTRRLATAQRKPQGGIYERKFQEAVFRAAEKILHPQLRPKP